jgi:hypothetical protein
VESKTRSILPDDLRVLGHDVNEISEGERILRHGTLAARLAVLAHTDQNNPTTAAAMVAAEKVTTMATRYAAISSRALASQCLPLFLSSQILNMPPRPSRFGAARPTPR